MQSYAINAHVLFYFFKRKNWLSLPQGPMQSLLNLQRTFRGALEPAAHKAQFYGSCLCLGWMTRRPDFETLSPRGGFCLLASCFAFAPESENVKYSQGPWRAGPQGLPF